MQNRPSLRSAFQEFLAEDYGSSHMEYMLIAALAIVVGALVVLAVRKASIATV